MWRTIDANGKLKIVGSTGPTGPTGPTGASSTLTPITAPIDANYSWVNQGGASVNVSSGTIYLNGPSTGVTSLRIREMSLPTGNYTLTAGFIPAIISDNFSSCGLTLRDSTTGAIVVFSYGFSTNLNVGLGKFTSPTAFSTAYTGAVNLTPCGQYLWMRIKDDGTNRIASLSMDGINFRTILSKLRTDFITPNKCGFYVDPNQSTGSSDANMTLVSWAITTP